MEEAQRGPAPGPPRHGPCFPYLWAGGEPDLRRTRAATHHAPARRDLRTRRHPRRWAGQPLSAPEARDGLLVLPVVLAGRRGGPSAVAGRIPAGTLRNS